MVGSVREVKDRLARGAEPLAQEIARQWQKDNTQRQKWLDDQKELQSYIFATDTSHTLGASGGTQWKHNTTIPKICQIRDNLHANYMAALYPNDNWLKWLAEGEDGLDKEKAKAVTSYMYNKLRQMNFRKILSDLVYDYIDYGNAFSRVEYVHEKHINAQGEEVTKYVGPKLIRISPYDLGFNPLARSFEDTPKITRELISIGELKARVDQEPDNNVWIKEAIQKVEDRRTGLSQFRNGDINKAAGISMAGFGSYTEYLESGLVEVFNFEGSMYDQVTGELLKNYIITVVDRDFVVRKMPNPSWIGEDQYIHVGWRDRPDNLYAMGPLHNLVGMQYKIDHLENSKADILDLLAQPPVKVKGNVEAFDWEPWAQIFVGDDGDVELLNVQSAVLGFDNQIFSYMQLMEEMAGAPKQSIGARTPGEKTAFEVQTLEQNAGKMFVDATTNFEVNGLEPALNKMLELARRHLDGQDITRVMDTEQGIVSFMSVTPADIKIKGSIRPMGARNFAKRATEVQNLQGALQMIQGDPGVRNHMSGKSIAKMIESGLDLERNDLYGENVQINESIESMQLQQAAQQTLAEEQATPTEDEF